MSSRTPDPGVHASPCAPGQIAPLPTARPLAPSAQAVSAYLTRLDERRIYSNNGPLSAELETRIAHMIGDNQVNVVTTASGTAALTALLRARVRSRPGLCLLPSWTFAATPAAALSAGLTPHFLEVDPQTWALDPDHVRARIHALCPTAVVVVAPFGAQLDWSAWAALEDETGVPIVIDAAAAFDALTHAPGFTGGPPTIVSLHATKPLGCGEGGLVITSDPDLAIAVRRMVNFGFHGDRVTREPGFNGKLSEYHAAVGLAALDTWATRRREWLAVKDVVREALCDARARVELGPDAASATATGTFNVILPSDVSACQLLLAKRGVNTLRWWGSGCAEQPAYVRYPADPLPKTRGLAGRVLGVPFFCDMTREQAVRLAEALADVTGARSDAPAALCEHAARLQR